MTLTQILSALRRSKSQLQSQYGIRRLAVLGSYARGEQTVKKLAVIRNFEVIGEAARQPPDEFKRERSAIPWRDLADFRNVLIHEYFGVDLKLVWQIIELDLAELKGRLAVISCEGRDGEPG